MRHGLESDALWRVADSLGLIVGEHGRVPLSEPSPLPATRRLGKVAAR
ncbi:hypothetical protein [Nitriliruptor alkaliphilus]|nr:hypothetical protein [Nitriliruptor alkaliphilus]